MPDNPLLMLEQYYKILGIQPTDDENAVKKAFRKLALIYHPDVNKNPEASEQFHLICEAYEILISKIKAETRVYADEETAEDDLISYEEIIKEAREKAAERARMKYEKIKAEKEFFQNNDTFVILRYIGNYLALPLGISLIVVPIIIAIREGFGIFFGLFFFWIVGSVILIHIHSKRKTWFRPGKITTTWTDIKGIFKTEIKENPTSKCFYSKNRMANSAPFKFIMFKVREIKLTAGAPLMHHVGYKRKFKEVVVPRSAQACRIHFWLPLFKIILIVLGMIYIPISSIMWRFIASFIIIVFLSIIIFKILGIYPKTSFLLTPFMIIKLSIWILVISSQTTIYSGFVMFTTETLPIYLIVMLLFLDMVLDLLLRIFPFFPKLYKPIIKQPPVINHLFSQGYQNYLDIPVWSTIYPFIRWIF